MMRFHFSSSPTHLHVVALQHLLCVWAFYLLCIYIYHVFSFIILTRQILYAFIKNDSVLYVFIILSFSHLLNNKTVFSFI